MKELIEKENIHLLYLKALSHFNNYQINAAFKICLKIMEKNYFHFDNLLIYTEILVEKKMIGDLFTCSTNMAENYPNHYMTFHIFGMYYFLLKKFDNSRKYFNKAIQMNKNSLKSWILLGHSFAN
jgi:anaphase-promoting complex subunit 6